MHTVCVILLTKATNIMVFEFPTPIKKLHNLQDLKCSYQYYLKYIEFLYIS